MSCSEISARKEMCLTVCGCEINVLAAEPCSKNRE